MLTRTLNIFLLTVLAFIAGMWVQQNREDIKDFIREMHHKCSCFKKTSSLSQASPLCDCGTCTCQPECRCKDKGYAIHIPFDYWWTTRDIERKNQQQEIDYLNELLKDYRFDAQEIIAGLPNNPYKVRIGEGYAYPEPIHAPREAN